MKKRQIVVNTIAFANQIQGGLRQFEFFEDLVQIGIEYVEVRHEYFCDQADWIETRKEAERLGVTLLYSVPRRLFRNGQLDIQMVKDTLAKAHELAAVGVKWTRGDFERWSESDMRMMRHFTESYPGFLTVENDQTSRDGSLDAQLAFLRSCEENSIPLFFTFDVGNWAWVEEDPVWNATQLRHFVQYIHVKDVLFTDGVPTAVPVGTGELPLQEVFRQLPKEKFVALEYPCGDHPLDLLRAGIDWLVKVQE